MKMIAYIVFTLGLSFGLHAGQMNSIDLSDLSIKLDGQPHLDAAITSKIVRSCEAIDNNIEKYECYTAAKEEYEHVKYIYGSCGGNNYYSYTDKLVSYLQSYYDLSEDLLAASSGLAYKQGYNINHYEGWLVYSNLSIQQKSEYMQSINRCMRVRLNEMSSRNSRALRDRLMPRGINK